jgi:hypothetical protein
MKQVSITQRVSASPQQIWNILRTGTNLDKWLPIIATCTLEGSGAGAKRTCTTFDGKLLKETILLVDDSNRVFKYRIDEQNMMPLRNYVGTVSVLERNGSTDVSWSTDFDLTEKDAEADVENALKGLFAMAISSLDSLAAKN